MNTVTLPSLPNRTSAGRSSMAAWMLFLYAGVAVLATTCRQCHATGYYVDWAQPGKEADKLGQRPGTEGVVDTGVGPGVKGAFVGPVQRLQEAADKDAPCDMPASITGGERTWSGLQVGDKVFYQCNTGFKLVGESEAECEFNQIWSNPPPTCEAEIECPPPTGIMNGCVYYTGTRVGSMIMYKCDPGYQRSGRMRVTCQSFGQWSHGPPTCNRRRRLSSSASNAASANGRHRNNKRTGSRSDE
ncbi:C4b-binding protein beta chain-like [Sycon ciliatum]|uniref:C4b-binding protein beta chain-like n=1 Tax=Sycon ciliatum TaxID=27933 RepID=UPI0031F68903